MAISGTKNSSSKDYIIIDTIRRLPTIQTKKDEWESETKKEVQYDPETEVDIEPMNQSLGDNTSQQGKHCKGTKPWKTMILFYLFIS